MGSIAGGVKVWSHRVEISAQYQLRFLLVRDQGVIEMTILLSVRSCDYRSLVGHELVLRRRTPNTTYTRSSTWDWHSGKGLLDTVYCLFRNGVHDP
jgi:hypothetical protein